MFYLILLILILVSLTYWLARQRIRENRYLKKKTRDSLSENVKDELTEEKFEEERLKNKFEEILKRKEK